MPALNRGTLFQLALLLLIVPAQYFLTQWKPTTGTQRSLEIQQFISKFHKWHEKLTNPEWWRQRGRNAWSTLSNFFDHFEKYGERVIYGGPLQGDDEDDPEGESPAIEVLKYRESNGNFGGSTERRSPRPSHVKFRIGQVVRHKTMGYRGVIVGWDLTAQAPEKWMRDNIPPEKRHYANQPNYLLLVNSNDKQTFSTAYITQELLDGVINTKVQHPQIEEYFENYDGSRYLARSWLRKIYPHDQ